VEVTSNPLTAFSCRYPRPPGKTEKFHRGRLGCVQYVCRIRLKENDVSNSLLSPEERNLTPDQVEALDKRRDLGHTFLVIACQFTALSVVLLLWVGQDLAYSPGWDHPMFYYFLLAVSMVLGFGVAGLVMRRGTPRID
jgi:hypothetical protein